MQLRRKKKEGVTKTPFLVLTLHGTNTKTSIDPKHGPILEFPTVKLEGSAIPKTLYPRAYGKRQTAICKEKGGPL